MIDERDRCIRFDKDCQPPSSARKRKSPYPISSTNPARLEKRIDDLYTLIGSVAAPKDGNSNTRPAPAESHRQYPGDLGSFPTHEAIPRATQTEQINNSNQLDRQTLTPASSQGTLSARPQSPSSLDASTIEPCEREAEELLDLFRAKMLKYAPFTVISPEMTASQLREQRPFLWLCIMTITTKSSSQQTALSHAVRTSLGRLMLVDGEKSHDLLYGTITCLAWYGMHLSFSM